MWTRWGIRTAGSLCHPTGDREKVAARSLCSPLGDMDVVGSLHHPLGEWTQRRPCVIGVEMWWSPCVTALGTWTWEGPSVPVSSSWHVTPWEMGQGHGRVPAGWGQCTQCGSCVTPLWTWTRWGLCGTPWGRGQGTWTQRGPFVTPSVCHHPEHWDMDPVVSPHHPTGYEDVAVSPCPPLWGQGHGPGGIPTSPHCHLAGAATCSWRMAQS